MDPKELNLEAILRQLQADKSVDRSTLLEAIRRAIDHVVSWGKFL